MVTLQGQIPEQLARTGQAKSEASGTIERPLSFSLIQMPIYSAENASRTDLAPLLSTNDVLYIFVPGRYYLSTLIR